MASHTVSSKRELFQVFNRARYFRQSGQLQQAVILTLSGESLTGHQSPLQKENVKTTENESLQMQIAYC